MCPLHYLDYCRCLRTVEVTDLVHEVLLLLRPGFVSREWFDAACRVLHARPRVLLESGAPGTLIALAREGHGIAVVPSTVRSFGPRVRPVPVLHGGTSIGRWMAANWDPRRFLAPYAELFVDALAAYAGRHMAHDFRHAPPIPLPPDPRESGGGERRSAGRRRASSIDPETG